MESKNYVANDRHLKKQQNGGRFMGEIILLKEYIRTIPNYPKNGIMFRDITPLLQDATAFDFALTKMEDSLRDTDFDVIVAPDSRGFIFGAPIARKMKKSFVIARKKGKLPYETIEEGYDLEYGSNVLQMHKDAILAGQKVVIVDDLMATGGTAQAIIKMVSRLGGQVVKVCCLIDLPDARGSHELQSKGYQVSSVIQYDGK